LTYEATDLDLIGNKKNKKKIAVLVSHFVQADPGVVGDADDHVVGLVVQERRGETVEEQERFQGPGGGERGRGWAAGAPKSLSALAVQTLMATTKTTVTAGARGSTERAGSGLWGRFDESDSAGNFLNLPISISIYDTNIIKAPYIYEFFLKRSWRLHKCLCLQT
jgi:hypothetical protein